MSDYEESRAILFSYTTIVVKPVFPTMADTIAYIFWYSEHMATVHYEQGKYHVHYDYIDAAKNGYPEKDSTISKSDVSFEHLVIANAYRFFCTAISRHRIFY